MPICVIVLIIMDISCLFNVILSDISILSGVNLCLWCLPIQIKMSVISCGISDIRKSHCYKTFRIHDKHLPSLWSIIASNWSIRQEHLLQRSRFTSNWFGFVGNIPVDSVGENWVVNRTGEDWAHQQPKAYTLEKINYMILHYVKYCTSSISKLWKGFLILLWMN